MKDPCQQVEEVLVKSGIEAVSRSEDLRDHVRSCSTCQPLLNSWRETGALLPLDDTVPENWNQRLLQRVAAPKTSSRNQRAASAIAATLVFASILGLVSQFGPRSFEASRAPSSVDYFAGKKDQEAMPVADAPEAESAGYGVLAQKPLFNEARAPASELPAMDAAPMPEPEPALDQGLWESDESTSSTTESNPFIIEERTRENVPQRSGRLRVDADVAADRSVGPADFTSDDMLAMPASSESRAELDRIDVTGARIKRSDIESAFPVFDPERQQAAPKPAAPPPAERVTDNYSGLFSHGSSRSIANDGNGVGSADLAKSTEGKKKAEASLRRQDRGANLNPDGPGQVLTYADTAGVGSDEQDLEALDYQSATGYWANPYIPGDPEIRLAQLQLEQDFPEVAALVQQLESRRQPVDPPVEEALALSVLADAAAVPQPTRMHVQVNLRAADQSAGRRPDVDLVTIVHSTAVAGHERKIHALLDALRQQRQTGDAFTVIASGQVDEMLAPGSLRFGPMEEFKQRISVPGNGISFSTAIDRASETLAGDENQALGSRHVIAVIDADPDDQPAAEAAVHRLARDGITLSIVSLSQQVSVDSVRGLALAGSGRYRTLADASKAEDILEEELAASARAVARAVRLSIRLHDSVRLVDIPGSYPLDTLQSQRVRDNEQAVDQRVARSMGIAADRGEDEDGIQIVIPAIFSGDDVSIILDVVANQAGPVADVTVRYKDLVQLTNGQTRAQLALSRYGNDGGPLQDAVARSALTQEMAQALSDAARAVKSGDIDEANRLLQALQSLLSNASSEHRDSASLRRDALLVSQLRDRLSSIPRQSMSQALEVAAWRKRHRDPDSQSESGQQEHRPG